VGWLLLVAWIVLLSSAVFLGARQSSLAQLEEDLDAWGTTLPAELLAEIDRIRWEIRDPAA